MAWVNLALTCGSFAGLRLAGLDAFVDFRDAETGRGGLHRATRGGHGHGTGQQQFGFGDDQTVLGGGGDLAGHQILGHLLEHHRLAGHHQLGHAVEILRRRLRGEPRRLPDHLVGRGHDHRGGVILDLLVLEFHRLHHRRIQRRSIDRALGHRPDRRPTSLAPCRSGGRRAKGQLAIGLTRRWRQCHFAHGPSLGLCLSLWRGSTGLVIKGRRLGRVDQGLSLGDLILDRGDLGLGLGGGRFDGALGLALDTGEDLVTNLGNRLFQLRGRVHGAREFGCLLGHDFLQKGPHLPKLSSIALGLAAARGAAASATASTTAADAEDLAHRRGDHRIGDLV
ncbi:hypothetical protein SPOA0394 (plasmid) [Ruegeria pomeroyi DSS-3]|uniref:Uncharacterized protein n=1 Tax=Ruegeria pomeroyi (strain ATCC 700808 / DSM 15171 / DSS-3) TaxID=246200 RepID=Q5LKI7_RUEPO|nr:hypothetical protein SPOA0394 [Ruegeria pomeroyi DSS-3]